MASKEKITRTVSYVRSVAFGRVRSQSACSQNLNYLRRAATPVPIASRIHSPPYIDRGARAAPASPVQYIYLAKHGILTENIYQILLSAVSTSRCDLKRINTLFL